VVALKLLEPAAAARPEVRERFFREAAAAARLGHPRVIQVFETVEEDGLCGYSMEYLDGTSLEQELAAGRLPLSRALPVFRAVCAGVAAAHGAGMIHGDLKPSNILLGKDGETVKVADFGMARLLGQVDLDATREHSRRVLGTINYMAPELRVETPGSDHRADIYSLGVILYRMLTGSLPLGSFRLPSHFGREIPPYLDRVILRCLRTDPAERYDSVADLLRDLGGDRPGFFARLAGRRRLLFFLAGAVLAGAVATVLVATGKIAPPGKGGYLQALVPGDSPLEHAGNLVRRGNATEAVAFLEAFASDNPDHPESGAAWVTAGNLRRQRGDGAGALAAYARAGGDAAAEAAYRRGDLLAEMGEEREAVPLLRRVRDRWPTTPWAPRALLRLGLLQEAMSHNFFKDIFGAGGNSARLSAVSTLEELAESYPASPEALSAVKELIRLYGPDGLDDSEAARRWRRWEEDRGSAAR